MDSFSKFIRSWSVYSKATGKPASAYCNGTKYVFIEGWPMTVQTYSLLTLRSVFGGGHSLTPEEWEALHAETRHLCKGLCLNQKQGQEAQSLVELFGNIMDISADALSDKDIISSWMTMLDDAVQEDVETGT